jgi:hypothetical protein
MGNKYNKESKESKRKRIFENAKFSLVDRTSKQPALTDPFELTGIVTKLPYSQDVFIKGHCIPKSQLKANGIREEKVLYYLLK